MAIRDHYIGFGQRRKKTVQMKGEVEVVDYLQKLRTEDSAKSGDKTAAYGTEPIDRRRQPIEGCSDPNSQARTTTKKNT